MKKLKCLVQGSGIALRTKFLVSLLWVAAHVIGASTAQAQHSFHAIGFADPSCGAWMKSQEVQVHRQAFLFWFRGFVTGANYSNATHQVFSHSMPNQETLTLYIDKHCRENPLKPIYAAAITLVSELRQPIDSR
jgi:hypothetical protein